MSFSQEEIRRRRQYLEDELRKLREQYIAQVEPFLVQLKQLQKDCLHPNAYEYSYWGGRDEGKKCPDCGWDDQN